MARCPRIQKKGKTLLDRERPNAIAAVASDHERRFDGLTRLISEWVWEVDADLRLTYVSERVAAVLGLSPTEMAGVPLRRFGSFTLDARPFGDADWRNPFSDVHFETMDVNGRLRLFLMNGLPIYHAKTGAFSGAHGTAREIDGRTETASTMMGSFLSHLSHDLRTPISTIIGFSGIMVDSLDGLSKEQQRTFAEHIHAAGNVLIELLDDAVDLARIDSGLAVASSDVFDLCEVLAESLEQLKPKADSRRVTLQDRISGSKEIYVRADRLRLRKIVQKLLLKAIQSIPEQGCLDIEVAPVDAAYRLRIAPVEAGAQPGKAPLGGAGKNQPAEPIARKEGKVLDTVAERMADLMKCRLGCRSELMGADTYWFEIPRAFPAASTPDDAS